MRQELGNQASRSPAATVISPTGSSNLATNGSTNGFHEDGIARSHLFYNHNREEVTRILLQSLSDLGYNDAASSLSKESGYQLEVPAVAAFRAAVVAGEWEEAEAIIFGPRDRLQNGHGHQTNGYDDSHALPLADGADRTAMKFLIRQQKYLELLEARDISAALQVLRNELAPLKRDIHKLHALSALIMCSTDAEVRARSEWTGVRGESRNLLLSELSKMISPSFMIPEHRLTALLDKVQAAQVRNCKYHNTAATPTLYTDHECSMDDFPMQPIAHLRNHSDEIFTLAFSDDGALLAAAGREGMIVVWETQRWKVKYELRDHERNATSEQTKIICQIAFSPNGQFLLSCSYSHEFIVTRMRDGKQVARGDHFGYAVAAVAWLPDNERFVIGSQDTTIPLSMYSIRDHGRLPGQNDLNQSYVWREPPDDMVRRTMSTPYRISALGVSPNGKVMAAGTTDHRLLMFDLITRERTLEKKMDGQITSITFSSDNLLMLINMSEDNVLSLDSTTAQLVTEYKGVHHQESVLHSCFGGAAESFVMSGSEDSTIRIWRKETGVLVAELKGHTPGFVNSVAWHPTNPAILASAGDDRTVKIWSSKNASRAQASPSWNL